MSKTNFNKVEKALDDSLLKMSIEYQTRKKTDDLPSEEQRTIYVSSLERELKRLLKEDKDAYSKLGHAKSEVKKLIANPGALTLDDWKKIKSIKEKVDLHLKELLKSLPQVTNEEIVEQEKKVHDNKRFNVKKGWIPLK